MVKRLDSARLVLAAALALSGSLPAQPQEPATPDAPAARIEELFVQDRIEGDGSYVRRQHTVVVLLTPGGAAQYAQVGVPFFEANQTAKLDLLRVVKADGRELDLLPNAPTDVAPLLPANLPIYSDLRLLRAAVPSLEVGDRLTCETSVRVQPLAERHVWTEMKFVDDVATQLYELDVPEQSDLSVHVLPGFEAQLEEERESGRWIRRWRRVLAVGETKAPAQEEPDDDLTPAPDVQVTSFRSWDQLGAWWASLAPPTVDAAIRAQAAELTATAVTPKERLRALHRYVAQEIRYLALPLGLGKYRAREPEEVVRTGLGDCKDKTRLLASLAASLGIEVDAVLVSGGERRAFVEASPNPNQFDHVVSRARIGKEEIWMDPTSEMSPMGRLPQNVRGLRAVAVDRRSAKTTIVETPQPVGWDRTVRTETKASIDAAGVSRATVRWTLDTDSEVVRMAVHYAGDAARRELVKGVAGEISEDTKIGRVEFADPRDVDAPFWIEFEVEQKFSPSMWRKAWTYPVPTTTLYLPAPPDKEDDAKRLAQGQAPRSRARLGSRGREVVTARVEFPEGVKVEPPVPVSLRREFAEYRSDYRVEGRTLIVERELVTKEEKVARDRFDQVRAFREQMKQDQAQEFDVAPAPDLVAVGAETADDLDAACWEEIEGKRYEAAEGLCRRATEVDPKHKSAWNGLGRALERQKRNQEAEAAYRKQIEIDPQHESAYVGLGRTFWKRGNLAAAEKAFRQQVEVTPLNANALSNLGGLLVQLGKIDEGEALLRRALKLEPGEEWTLEALFEVEARRGRLDALGALAAEHPELPRERGNRFRIVHLALANGKGSWKPLAAWLERTRAEAESALESFEGTPDAAAMGSVSALALLWEVQGRVALEEKRAADAVALLAGARALGSDSAVAGLAEARRAAGPAAPKPSAGGEDVTAMAMLTRRVPEAAGTEGEIWLVFGADGRLVKATAIGPKGPKALAASLAKHPLTIPVPPANRARLPLKLLAYCSAAAECNLTVERPGQTWGGLEHEGR